MEERDPNTQIQENQEVEHVETPEQSSEVHESFSTITEEVAPTEEPLPAKKASLKQKLMAKIQPILAHLKKRPKIVLILGILFSLLFTALGSALIMQSSEAEANTPKEDEHKEEKAKESHVAPKAEAKEEVPAESTQDPEIAAALIDLLLERELYLRAAELEPLLSKNAMHSPELAAKLGRALIGAGQSAKALPYLEQAMKMDGQNNELKSLLLLGRIRAGSTEPHLHDLADLAKTEKENTAILANYADALLSLGKDQEAAEALSHWKLSPELMSLRAKALMRTEGCKGAQPLSDQIVSMHPEQQKAWAILGFCAHKAGNAALALKAYHWATGLNTEDYNSWYNLGELHYGLANASSESQAIQEQNRLALDAMLHSVRYAPEHPEAHYRIGTLLLYNKQYREAIQHFSLAKNESNLRVRSLLQISSAWQNLGDSESAKAYMDSAKATTPKDPEVQGQAEALESKPHLSTAKTESHTPSSSAEEEKPTEFKQSKESPKEVHSEESAHSEHH